MSPIDIAITASKHPIVLDTGAQLARAHKAWKKSTVLGIDTEFLRERTYWAQLGLIQVSDGQTAWLIDPLVIDNLEPFLDLMNDPSCTLIFHSPTEDLEVLWHSLGVVPANMVDTQLACAMLGQPLQMSYHNTAQWLLEVPVSKDQTRSNWTKRPLTDRQLEYAALDVTLLPLMWSDLKPRLVELDRGNWLSEDIDRLVQSTRCPTDPQQAYLRIKGALRLNPPQVNVLRALAAWREEQAVRQDLPRGFVIKDNILLQIASMKNISLENLLTLKDIRPHAVRRYGNKIVEICRSGNEEKNFGPVMSPLGPDHRKLLELMRQLILSRAESLNVDPALLASKKELEKLLRCMLTNNDLPDRFTGWRYPKITQELESIFHSDES
jgi:ribonuclease D